MTFEEILRSLRSLRFAVLALTAFSPFGCSSQVICPCKNSLVNDVISRVKRRLNYKQDKDYEN